jgi:hypothetical protein
MAPTYRRPWNPGDDGVIALLQVCHVAADMRHNSGAFVAKAQRSFRVRVPHLVQLGMTDTRRKQLDDDLIRSWVRDLNLIDGEWSAVLRVNCGD